MTRPLPLLALTLLGGLQARAQGVAPVDIPYQRFVLDNGLTLVAKEKRTLTLSGRWETAGAVANSLGEVVRFGYDDCHFETYAGKVQALALEDVTAATKVLDPDHLIWVAVGDRSKVEAGIRELNLGELRVIDADGRAVSGGGTAGAP